MNLIIALINAAATAVNASGVTDAKVRAIAELLRKGSSLAATGVTAGTNFVAAMTALTNQVKAMSAAGVDDLTDQQAQDIDDKIEAAHQEIQRAR